MRDFPIIFSGPMVRALLDGSKTQTRRIPTAMWRKVKAGDRLYVRETWGDKDADHPLAEGGRKPQEGDPLVFRANPADDAQWSRPGHPGISSFVWRPSIHMPRGASRITLEVTEVREQKLQEITEQDAKAEGCEPRVNGVDELGPTKSYRCGFVYLWGSLHEGKPGHSWLDNPETIALTFQAHYCNIDKMKDG